MKWLLGIVFVIIGAMTTLAQQAPPSCPVGSVCFTQTQSNDIFQKLSELVAAKDLIIKLQTQAGTADTALANALKVIEGHVELHKVDDQIIVKKDQIIALFERVITIQNQIIENLEKRLMRGKSAWQKIVAVVEKIGILLAGIALGGAL